MTWKRNVLVVANVTATSEELVRRCASAPTREPTSFTLVIPALRSEEAPRPPSEQLREALSTARRCRPRGRGA